MTILTRMTILIDGHSGQKISKKELYYCARKSFLAMFHTTSPPSFEQLPSIVADLNQKVDYLTTLLVNQLSDVPRASESLPDLLTIKQAAEYVNLAVPTLYGMVGRKEIPFMKRAKKLYFSRQELDAWVREGRKKTNTECAREVRLDLKAQRS